MKGKKLWPWLLMGVFFIGALLSAFSPYVKIATPAFLAAALGVFMGYAKVNLKVINEQEEQLLRSYKQMMSLLKMFFKLTLVLLFGVFWVLVLSLFSRTYEGIIIIAIAYGLAALIGYIFSEE